MHDGPRYRLELVALPSDAPAIIRLRAALKLFLRAYRLRCISAVEVAADDGQAAPPATPPEDLAGGGRLQKPNGMG